MESPSPPTIAVFGLGEAGSAIAADLASSGAHVVAFDPAPVADVGGVRRVAHPADAVADAGLVLAITAAADAKTALQQALDQIPRRAVYVDLSTASAALKIELSDVAEAAGLLFADVALMSTVPGKGLGTPALVSGSGADDVVHLLSPLGSRMESIGDEPGVAATRKLLRSVVMKGLAALLIESMRAAQAAGLVAETWQNLIEEFTGMDEQFLRRLVDGTGVHALRRRHEMEASAQLLDDLGIEPVMTSATIESLRRVHLDDRSDWW